MKNSSATKGVLVLDGIPRVIIAICRSLHSRHIPVICAQLGRSGLSLGSNAATADVSLPAGRAPFFEHLNELLSRYDIDTIVPCSDSALRMLMPHYQELAKRAYITFPEPETLLQVLDKDATLKLARECGISIPRTYELDDFDALRFPLIAKPSNAGALNPFKIKYFDTAEELEAFIKSSGSEVHHVLQEFVPGEGVGVATVVAEGKPLALFQHKRIHEWPARGGVGVLVMSEALDPTLASAAGALLRRLEWRGPAMVEFRRNRQSGEFALMEINGRFWGSLPLAISAGLDFPYYQWQVAHHIEPQVPATYDIGLRMRWTTGEIRRLVDLMTSSETREVLHYSAVTPVTQFVQSFDPRVRSALFSRADPRPAITDLVRTLTSLTLAGVWSLLKRVLPASYTRRISQLRYLDAAHRKVHLALWFFRSVRFRGHSSATRVANARRVTFLCRGNRIRSPLAAAILESKLNGGVRGVFQIRSAGTRAVQGGSFDPRAQATAKAMGLDLTGRAQSVTADLIKDSDLIVVMDRLTETEVVTQFPASIKKVFLFGDIVGGPEAGEVPDPDKSPPAEFSRYVALLTANVELLAHRLSH